MLPPTNGADGDLNQWCRTPSLERLDVVDVDPVALEEYGRRLVNTYGATLERGTWVLPRHGMHIHLHCADALRLPP